MSIDLSDRFKSIGSTFLTYLDQVLINFDSIDKLLERRLNLSFRGNRLPKVANPSYRYSLWS